MTVRGWCPSLHEPMASGDGLLVRVKPRGGRMSAVAARAVAEAAERYGNGVIELTNRANLQIRGLSSDSAKTFAQVMVMQGMAEADPAAERRRTVIASPLADSILALDMEAMLASDTSLAALPAKFGVVVDAGGPISVANASGDIRVIVRDELATIALDGGEAVTCTPGEAVTVTQRLIHAFLATGTPRMRDLDAATRTIVIASGAKQSRVGALPLDCFAPLAMTPVGPFPGAYAVGLPFGQITAATLRHLADLTGMLHLTPWRAVLLEGVTQPPLSPELITDPTDPRPSIAACPGHPACGQASTTTRADAAWLAATGLTHGRTIHVSGCAKGCAHPGSAAITLVGDSGRYHLVRNGRADAVPTRRGLTIEQAAGELG